MVGGSFFAGCSFGVAKMFPTVPSGKKTTGKGVLSLFRTFLVFGSSEHPLSVPSNMAGQS